jgi:hypothetical protein
MSSIPTWDKSKRPDLKEQGASLRKTVWRELSGLTKSGSLTLRRLSQSGCQYRLRTSLVSVRPSFFRGHLRQGSLCP